jgi:putative ABC transport system permease protein
VPAKRPARRFIHRTAELRRAALEVAVVAAATAAAVALHQRGILPAPPSGGAPGAGGLLSSGGGVLPASAPALGAVAGAVLLLRMLPAGLGVALGWALRARRPLLLFGTARAAATAGRALPVLAMVAAAALASFALTLDATANRGLADGAWQTVGADARLDLAPDPAPAAAPDAAPDAATADLARALAARPGVRQVVTAQVTDDARVLTGQTLVTPRLVIVDSAAFRRLLASTPLPDAPALALLAPAGAEDVPALVRSADGGLRPGMRLELPREGADPVPLRAVGTAPRVGDVEDVVIVDARALSERGVPVVPDTVWVLGPGTAKAVVAAGGPADVVLRATVLHDRRSAPLTAGLLRLALTSAMVLLVAGVLGLALGAAAGAPDRWQTLSRLRTLGLRVRDARRVAAGELLPPVAVAAVGGPLLGVLLARLTLGPLSLRVLTGQPGDPPLGVPWWVLLAVAVALLLAVAVVVPVESALRRRRGLAEVLRAGG